MADVAPLAVRLEILECQMTELDSHITPDRGQLATLIEKVLHTGEQESALKAVQDQVRELSGNRDIPPPDCAAPLFKAAALFFLLQRNIGNPDEAVLPLISTTIASFSETTDHWITYARRAMKERNMARSTIAVLACFPDEDHPLPGHVIVHFRVPADGEEPVEVASFDFCATSSASVQKAWNLISEGLDDAKFRWTRPDVHFGRVPSSHTSFFAAIYTLHNIRIKHSGNADVLINNMAAWVVRLARKLVDTASSTEGYEELMAPLLATAQPQDQGSPREVEPETEEVQAQ
ncbi:hypothetical protein CMEL01_16798 [Colletotrichum melonis]|uniref:Uncharacterized protein n=1 Tax=Colletotrichum melonis TaxID=1209925 RepID=A0AAI9XJ08_9PEZI|nr:hypothetical protein CMEL01_16798 [Colletotrichum melonis]